MHQYHVQIKTFDSTQSRIAIINAINLTDVYVILGARMPLSDYIASVKVVN